MPKRNAGANDAGSPALDWLIAAAGLLGGTLLLAAHRRPAPALDAIAAETDRSARAGRGRPRTPPSTEAERLGYEPQDADAGAVGWSMFGLAAAAILSVFALLGLLALFHAQLRTARPTYTGEQSTPVEPPKPRLESYPATDLQTERARERKLLDGYGWRDAAHTRARIPIDRAMALLVGRPLDPPRQGPP